MAHIPASVAPDCCISLYSLGRDYNVSSHVVVKDRYRLTSLLNIISSFTILSGNYDSHSNNVANSPAHARTALECNFIVYHRAGSIIITGVARYGTANFDTLTR